VLALACFATGIETWRDQFTGSGAGANAVSAEEMGGR